MADKPQSMRDDFAGWQRAKIASVRAEESGWLGGWRANHANHKNEATCDEAKNGMFGLLPGSR